MTAALAAQPRRERRFHWGSLVTLAFKLLKVTKAAKGAMAASTVASFAWLWTFEGALVIVAGLVVHEYGHLLAMKVYGLKTKGIYLIPFVGGAAVADEEWRSRGQEAFIALAGPAAGVFAAAAFVLLHAITGAAIWAGAALLTIAINLLQFLPVLPLDGGRMLRSLMFSVHSGVGFLAMLAMLAFGIFVTIGLGSWLFATLLLVGTLDLLFEMRRRLPLPGMGGLEVWKFTWTFLAVLFAYGTLWSFVADSPGADVARAALTGNAPAAAPTAPRYGRAMP